jgi:hypothetical protein
MYKVLVIAAVLFVFLSLGIVVIRHSRQVERDQRPANAEKRTFLVNDSELVAFGRWPMADMGRMSLSYSIRKTTVEDCPAKSGVTLSIATAEASVYEEKFCFVNQIYQEYVLRTPVPQLVVSVNEGGNESFLKILNYENGKVTDLLGGLEPSNDYGSDATVRPQFRGGVRPSTEPFEVLLTRPGLASTGEKRTTVFRLKNDKYEMVGEFSATQADDFIEKIMK